MNIYKRILWVQEKLPMVKIRYNDQLYLAYLTGRKNDFATAILHRPYTQEKPGKLGKQITFGQAFEFAWETVAKYFEYQHFCLQA